MDKGMRKGNITAGILCGLLLICAGCIYYDAWGMFEKDGEVITVGVFSDSYWGVQNGYSYQILDDAIAVFQGQNPGVKVKYVSGILKEDYSEWLAEGLISGEAPDLFFILLKDFNDFAGLAALKDLTPLIDRDEDVQTDMFYSSAYAYGKYKDRQYCLPYECAPKLMFVNKSILDKEGIDMPGEEWTWDEFYKICRQVTKDTDKDGVLDQFGTVGYTWRDAFDSNGVELFDQQGKQCSLTGENVKESIQFMEKLESIHEGYSVASREFDLGNVAFQPMSFSEYRAYQPYPLSVKKYSGFEWNCIPMPAGPHGDNISTLDTLMVAMNENTRHEKAAWNFMKTLVCNTQIQSEIFDYSEGVSVLKEVTESDQVLQRLMEEDGSSLNLNLLSDAVEHAVVTPRFRYYDDAMAEVDRAVADIMEGDANIGMGQIIWNRAINKALKNSEW